MRGIWAVLFGLGVAAVQAETIVLQQDGRQAAIDAATGCVVAFGLESSPNCFATADRYRFGGEESGEAADRMTVRQRSADTLVLEGGNLEIGLLLRKEYRLADGELVKIVTYRTDSGERRLFELSGETRFTAPMAEEGYFFLNIDDGYKVQTLPYIAVNRVIQPTGWGVARGALVYYHPGADETLSHYRYRINGRYFYGESNKSTESRLLPDGAITALASDFLEPGGETTVESRFLAEPGDPRTYLRRIYEQEPFASYRNRPVPEWFLNTMMYFPPGGCGDMLINRRDEVLRDLRNILPLLAEDQYLMIFFNHWGTSGDYPSTGTMRYLEGTRWSEPIPVEAMKEAIREVKALSPKIKFGAYFFFAPAGDSPIVREHPEWFIYNADGSMEQGGDGIGSCFFPDMSSGYREYLLQQLKDAVSVYGMDWLHLDSNLYENTNFRTRNVVQTADWAELYRELGEFTADNDAAIVQNVAWCNALWADGTYFECQQPERWERKDWRIMGVSGYLAAVSRTNRPGVWANLCYGGLDAWGLRNTFCGMKGWVRDCRAWWLQLPASLERELFVSELLQTKLAEIEVKPDWWKLETETLEVLPLQLGDAVILSLVEHGAEPVTETIALAPRQLPGFQPEALLFRHTLELRPPKAWDLVDGPVPAEVNTAVWSAFEAGTVDPAEYRNEMTLTPLTNVYCVLSQVPGWVYEIDGRRTGLPLPENRGVKLTGRALPGMDRYTLTAENPRQSARVQLWLPREWHGARVTVNGAEVNAPRIERGEDCFALIDLPNGQARIEVASATAATVETAQPYREFQWPHWQQMVHRMDTAGIGRKEAGVEDGKTWVSFELQQSAASVELPLYVTPVRCDAIEFAVLGSASGMDIRVTPAGFTVKDDFTGWKNFSAPIPVESRELHRISFQFAGQPGDRAVIGDLRLVPAAAEEVTAPSLRRVVARRVAQPVPLIAKPGDAWDANDSATDFYRLSSPQAADGVTDVRLSYDENYLYVLFQNFEPIDDLGVCGERDSQIWGKDHVELYLQPHPDTPDWFQIMVDPAKTIQDIQYTELGSSAEWNGEFDLATALNWKVAWTAMLRIPFTTLNAAPPQPGERWRVNFARLDLTGEWSNWGTTSGDWLDTTVFGELVFGDEDGKEPAPGGLTFHCPFDGATAPAAPPDGGGEAAGVVEFIADGEGKGLVTGHDRGVVYPAAGRLNPQAGTVLFRIKPLDWNRYDDNFHHFFTAPAAAPGGFDLNIYRFGDWDNLMVYSTALGLVNESIPQVDFDDSWVDSRWHQVAFAWDEKTALLYLDGRTSEHRIAPGTLAAPAEFRVGGPYFVPNDTRTAIADLMIFSRKLTPREIEACLE